MEEMIAQRLLDNARLLDQLLVTRGPDPRWLQDVIAMNRLSRVELLDRDGRPYTPPPPPVEMTPFRRMMRGGPPPGGPGPRHAPPDHAGPTMAPPGPPDEARRPMPPGPPDEAREGRRQMTMYMWGRRWAPPLGEEPAPPAIQDRRFWQGSVFGVAVGARSFPGIIAVHADADYVLNFSREIGVQRQVEELGRQRGVRYISLLDGDLTVVASSDPSRVGRRDDEGALRAALQSGQATTRLIDGGGAGRVYEVVRPLPLAGPRPGLLRVGLSTASLDSVWRHDWLMAVALALGVLGVGAIGLGAIFYAQHRHLAEVKTLEAEMERGERLSALGNMAAAVAHEIRNPLNAISMGLQRVRAEFGAARGRGRGVPAPRRPDN